MTAARDVALPLMAALLSASVWPLNRWARIRGATPAGTGLVLSVVGLGAGLVLAWVTGQPLYHPAAFFLGALAGVAYSIGFVLLLLRCLGQGPMGPTVTAASLSLAAPVLTSLLLPYAEVAQPRVYAGLGGALVAIALLTLAPTLRPGSPAPPRRWSIMLALGWLFTGLAGVAQLMSGRYAPEAAASSIIGQYLVCLLCLLVAASAESAWPRAADLVAGAGTGLVTAVALPASFTVIGAMHGAYAYALTSAGPALLLAILGGAAWRERLTPWAWLGCAVGITALVLLGLSRP